MSTKMDRMVEAVKKHALENYNTGGWDFVVETYDDRRIAEVLQEEGCRTNQEAIRAVGNIVMLFAHDRHGQLAETDYPPLNMPRYSWYVVDKSKNKIESGWEYEEDAQDAARAMREESRGAPHVVAPVTLGRKYGLDPNDNNDWIGGETMESNPGRPRRNPGRRNIKGPSYKVQVAVLFDENRWEKHWLWATVYSPLEAFKQNLQEEDGSVWDESDLPMLEAGSLLVEPGGYPLETAYVEKIVPLKVMRLSDWQEASKEPGFFDE